MWNSRSDVLVLVLVRLPPKSLGRFKVVSRSWNVLISSSEFIRLHLQYHQSSIILQKKVYTLLSRSFDWRLGFGTHEAHLAEYSINYDEENLELGCEIQPVYNPYEIHAPRTRSLLVGSCNGLICQIRGLSANIKQHSVFGDEYEISLCNPLTKSTWVLPKTPLLSSSREEEDCHVRVVVCYGFGYDDVHDTYKVFLASGAHDDGSDRLPVANYVYKVYNLRSDKWIMVSPDELVDDIIHDYWFHFSSCKLDGVLINCALHWILRKYHYNSKNHNQIYILAFDLRVDKFSILPVPEAASECSRMSLIELNGCLLLCDQDGGFTPEHIVDLWLMKDYGSKDSWTRIRIRNSSYSFGFITPVALVEEEDNRSNHHRMRKLIYHDTRHWDSRPIVLLSYDIESHQVEEFPTPSALAFHRPQQLHFVASLVHPHPPSGFPENVY